MINSQSILFERAVAAAEQYMLWRVDQGDKLYLPRKKKKEKDLITPLGQRRSRLSSDQKREEVWWWVHKEKEWSRSGRISSAGYLGLPQISMTLPWTAVRVQFAFNHLRPSECRYIAGLLNKKISLTKEDDRTKLSNSLSGRKNSEKNRMPSNYKPAWDILRMRGSVKNSSCPAFRRVPSEQPGTPETVAGISNGSGAVQCEASGANSEPSRV